jgi:replicative DNA helicase
VSPPDRLPPHDIAAERAVLGALLLKHELFDLVVGVLRPGDFYSDSHTRIYAAMLALHEERAPIDSITLRADLDHRGELAAVGGDDYLLGLTDTIPTFENTKAYATLVAKKALARRVILTANALAARAYAASDDEHALAGWGIEKLEELSSAPEFAEVLSESAADLADSFVADLDAEEASPVAEISLGLPKLKEMVGSLFPGAVLVIGADTNVGKSSFVLEVLLAAAKDGTRAGYVSMEDPRDLYRGRAVSALSHGVSPRGLKLKENRQRVLRGAEALAELCDGVFFSECIGMSEAQVMTRMSFMAKRGVRLIAVDYIQEVHASVPQQDRRNEVRWVLSRLKGHAARLGVALVVVSQLSRPKDSKPGREPFKHDLKEAGDLENSAEFIVMLWREEQHDYHPIKLKLEKSKTGGIGWKWLMQREVFATDAHGRRVLGSARLREVVEDHSHPADRDFPLVVNDYVAQIDILSRQDW